MHGAGLKNLKFVAMMVVLSLMMLVMEVHAGEIGHGTHADEVLAETGVEMMLEFFDRNADNAIDEEELNQIIGNLTAGVQDYCASAHAVFNASGIPEGGIANTSESLERVLSNLFPCVLSLATAAEVTVLGPDGNQYLCQNTNSLEHDHRVLEEADHGHGHEDEPVEIIFGSKTLACELVPEEDVLYNVTGQTWGYSILASLLASMCSLAGAVLILCKKNVITGLLLDDISSFGVGVLLGVVMLHMMPEAAIMVNQFNWTVGLALLVGIITAMFIEKTATVLGAHHHGDDFPDATPTTKGTAIVDHEKGDEKQEQELNYGMVWNITIGDGIHNLLDGFLIGIAFMACPDSNLGWIITLAVICHELPQEMVDFMLLLRAGLQPKKALLFNLASSLTSVVGVLIVLSLSSTVSESTQGLLLACGAGFLVYIALAEITPILLHSRVSKTRETARFLLMIIGITLMGLLQLFHPACGDAH